MNNKERFYREDYKTFKPKYFLFCYPCKFKLNRFGSLENIPYIRRIEIKEIEK